MAKTRISCPKSHANLRAAFAVLSMLIAVCAHAQTARAGSGSNLPAQLSVVPPNSWLAVPNSTIHAVLPVPGADIGYGGPEDITAAWNSGAYDPTRSRLYILGGGHGGYSGNEAYAFD